MKRGTPRHPKMYALSAALSIPLPYAVGIMEMLWHHAAQHTPRGDIGSLPDAAIAEACSYRKPENLIAALVSSGWLDRDPEYRLIVHDWPQHCESSVRKWLDRNEKEMLPVYAKCLDIDETLTGKCPPSREAMAEAKASEDLSKKKDGEILPPHLDPQWQDFRKLYLETGKPLIEQDFQKAHFIWRVLDFEQRTRAIANLAARKLHHDPQFIPMPAKYLEGSEYTRAVIARTNGSGKYLTNEELAAL